MPGDHDAQYASPWAGANFLPMSTQENSRWERRTWPELRRLAVEVPEAGIHLQKALVYRNAKDLDVRCGGGLSEDLFAPEPWYSTFFPDYRKVPASELPPGTAYGHEFGSVCINTAIYLAWLVGQCRKLGVVIKRASLSHISEAASLHYAHEHDAAPANPSSKDDIIVVNATGLLACQLGGVMDKAVQPARAQVVVVRNDSPAMYSISSTDNDPPEELVYSMTRAVGGGTILGGTYDKGNWDPAPDPAIAQRIMQRIVAKFPQIAPRVDALDVVRHAVGLRPYRDGGVRLDKELVDGVWVVHNYGHAGWGFQGSYGTAERVVELVGDITGRTAGAPHHSARL
ncbi:D-amino-acid oxidase-like protein [Coniella lustricola]|uniref:D-amino-acid oxidase-like protein n=1 Tax=Coniella lustricola TaxID=2025994 RepID=A0A2T2ZUX2_9PEZI|nr:D-amino-acid oxidase-like protein [Coniella lustricola]